MKMKDLYKYKRIFLIPSILAAAIISNQQGGDYTWIYSNVIGLGMIGTLKLENKVDEYKKMEEIYSQIIKNTANFCRKLGVAKDPISLFATFVYMYRNGTLSLDLQFEYSIDLKDYMSLPGADIVRGKGVCRNIADMFSDLANELGMESSILLCSANREGLRKKEKLSLVDIEKEDKAGNFVTIIEKITKYIKIANHVVTIVKFDNKKYVLDPTNDVFLTRKNKKMTFINDTSAHMTQIYSSSIVAKIIGMYEKVSVKDEKLEEIDYIEYVKTYLETNKIIKENIDSFNKFYKDNKDLYEELNNIANQNGGMFKRALTIPNKKIKKM